MVASPSSSFMTCGGDFFKSAMSLRVSLLLPILIASIARISASTFVVTNTSDSGSGSLRQAITDANTHPNSAGVDNVQFNISGAGVHTITLASALPDITEGVMLDGWSQPGFQTTPLIELTAASGLAADGLRILSGSTHIRGFVINGFVGNDPHAGIYVGPQGGNVIEGCYIGTDKTGTQGAGNQIGIFVRQSGTTLIVRNLISGNRNEGIRAFPNSNHMQTETVTVQGNFIGTDVTGTMAVPNGTAITPGTSIFWSAVSVSCPNALIGGTSPGEGNLVSGNGRTDPGYIMNGVYAVGIGSRVFGNFIGTTVSGAAALPNFGAGVKSNATVGGPEPGARNIISGNAGPGVDLFSVDGVVQGNFIGTDVSGKLAVPNATGVVIPGGANNLVGGSFPGAGNLISGNLGAGISFLHALGFFINPNDIPPVDNIVQGNLIGTDVSGSKALPNGEDGVFFQNINSSFSALRNQIGGTISRAANVISGNLGNGVGAFGPLHANSIQGNFIGTAADGQSPLGNGKNGIAMGASLSSSASNASIANRIAFNSLNGISVTGTGHRLSGNSIHDNGLLGIDLSENGPTPNDPGDGDAGPNDLQNFPLITAAFGFNGNLTIYGNLNSTPSKSFTLEFFANQAADNSGFGEGQIYLGRAQVTTNSSGDAPFNVTFPLPANVTAVAATAIDESGNTSEFSAAIPIAPTAPTTPPTGPTAVVLPSHPAQLLNLSTRLRVETGNGVLIAGFIVSGNDPKKIIVRGLGPSLAAVSAPARLGDPAIELHDSFGELATNDNWKQNQQTEIENSGVAATNDLESAIVRTVPPGNYTVILRGQNNGTGIGLVEVYDLGQSADSYQGNVSTRGFVGTGDNVMISGFIAGGTGGGNTTVAIRGLGPSLASFGISNFLADPTLELRNVDGTLVQSNNEWRDSENFYGIRATGLGPEFSQEAVILYPVTPGNYTAILRGASNGTGVGLLEVYNLR